MIDGLPFRVDPSMRRPRYFPANCVYEVTLRVREGLPFAPKQVIELLLKSAMACRELGIGTGQLFRWELVGIGTGQLFRKL